MSLVCPPNPCRFLLSNPYHRQKTQSQSTIQGPFAPCSLWQFVFTILHLRNSAPPFQGTVRTCPKFSRLPFFCPVPSTTPIPHERLTHSFNRSAANKMDATTIRSCIAATLDADADVRRRAELQLTQVRFPHQCQRSRLSPPASTCVACIAHCFLTVLVNVANLSCPLHHVGREASRLYRSAGRHPPRRARRQRPVILYATHAPRSPCKYNHGERNHPVLTSAGSCDHSQEPRQPSLAHIRSVSRRWSHRRRREDTPKGTPPAYPSLLGTSGPPTAHPHHPEDTKL